MDDKWESEDQPLTQEDLEKTAGGGMESPEVDMKHKHRTDPEPDPVDGHKSFW